MNPKQFSLVVGIILVVIGVYIGGRLVVQPDVPITKNFWLDVAFAFFFVLRGVMNISKGRGSFSRPT